MFICTQLTEITADLADEHSTATSASEMLESEAAERMRLEKELKELKVKSLLVWDFTSVLLLDLGY